MCYLKFDKAQMTNLQDSLYKEFLITNRSGAYCNTTLVGCNIRKYHGLMVVPVPELDDENHVLLSSLDETIIQHGAEFNLGLHKYQGENYSPKGHKYIVSFQWDKVPTWIYRIGGVLLKKEMAFCTDDYQFYIRYTLLDAHSATTLRLKPFLAFRSVRQWTHENSVANSGYTEVKNGIKMCLYQGYPDLFMQTNVKSEFHYCPDWYRGLDYPKERERGYDATEDLLVPGYFEMPIKKGQSVVFSAALNELAPNRLGHYMEEEREALDERDSFYHCLVNAAHQFNVRRDGKHYILAGYPWFKCRARDTFISMPGLTLSIGEREQYEKYMDAAAEAIRQFINKEHGAYLRNRATRLAALGDMVLAAVSQECVCTRFSGEVWRTAQGHHGICSRRTPLKPLRSRKRTALFQRTRPRCDVDELYGQRTSHHSALRIYR